MPQPDRTGFTRDSGGFTRGRGGPGVPPAAPERAALPDPVRPLPRWAVLGGSAVVAAHFCAVLGLVLSASSGPWPTPFGGSNAPGPQFAQAVNEVAGPNYLYHLKLTHNYHFPTNRPDIPGVYFEVHLKGKDGEPLKTVRIPDQGANPWVQHRQWLLAQALADDQPINPPGGEFIPAPGQKGRTVQVWDWEVSPDQVMSLRTVPEHLLPRNRPVYFRPSEWSLILARAYVRHLCREHGAESGELIRHFREPVLAGFMLSPEPPPNIFQEIVCNFGEIKP